MHSCLIRGSLMIFIFTYKPSNATAENPITISRGEQQREIFQLLREADEEIKLDENYRDVVLLIGNAGAGKTTIGLMLTTNCADLEVYSPRRGVPNLIRESNGTRIGSSIASKTTFPDLMINPENDVAFYDCPGFRDTRHRNMSIEFANTLFFQRITRHAKSVKILMIVNYNAVIGGGSREDFLNSLESTLNLIRTTDRFNNSIGMVATKVDSDFMDSEEIVEGVKEFLLYEVKGKLRSVMKNREDERRAGILLDALLADGKNEQPKIHFTRVPQGRGRLSDMPDMMGIREKIGDMVYNGLEYASVTPEDFGLPFSVEARELVGWILGEIDIFTESQIQKVVNEVWTSLVETMGQVEDLPGFILQLKMLKNQSETLVTDWNGTSLPLTSALASDILEKVNNIGINVSHIVGFSTLEDQDRFLRLMYNVTNQVPLIEVSKWVRPVQNFLSSKIQKTIDWFQSLIDIERQFCPYVGGFSTGTCEEGYLTTANSTYITSRNYHRFLSKFLDVAGNSTHPIPGSLEPEHEELTYRFLNGMVERGKQGREQRITRWVEEVGVAVKQHFLQSNRTNSIDSVRQQLLKAEKAIANISTLNRLVGRLKPEDFMRDVHIILSKLPEFHMATEQVDHINHEAAVSDLLNTVANDAGEFNASTALRPLEKIAQFLTESITWWDFLREINKKLLPGGQVSRLTRFENLTETPPTYIVRSNIPDTMKLLSVYLKVPRSLNLALDPSQIPIFVKNLNDVLYFTWQRRSSSISAALNDLAQNLIQHLRSQTGCSIQALPFSETVKGRRQALEEKLEENPKIRKEPAALAHHIQDMLHTIFGPPVYNVSRQQIEHIKGQHAIFLIMEFATPGLAEIDVTQALFKLRPVSSYLRRLSNWYDLMTELQGKLAGTAVNLNSFYTEIPSSVNSSDTTWYNFVNQSVSSFGLQFSVSPLEDIHKDMDEHGMFCHVHAIVNAAYETRMNATDDIVATAWTKLLQKLHLQAESSALDLKKFTEQLQKMIEAFKRLSHLPVTVKNLDVSMFLEFLSTSLAKCGNYGEESREVLKLASQPAQILNSISTAFPLSFPFNPVKMLTRFQGPLEFIPDFVKWHNFLQEISENLSAFGFRFTPKNSSSRRAGPSRPLISSGEDSIKILTPLSQLLSVKQPSIRSNVSETKVLLRYIERLVCDDWHRRNEEVAQILKNLTKLLAESYFNLTKTAEVHELRNATANGFSIFHELQKSENDSSLLNASGLAARLQQALAAIKIETQAESGFLVSWMSLQDKVLGIYGNVSPSLSHIDLHRSLHLLTPLISQLRWQSDWFKLLCDVQYELSRKGLMHPTFLTLESQSPWQIPTWDSARHIIMELANILKVGHAVDFGRVPQISDSAATLGYLSRLVSWAYDTRVRDVRNRIEQVALQIFHGQYNSSASKLRQEIAGVASVLQLLNSTAETPMEVSVIKSTVAGILKNSSLFTTTDTFQPSLDAIGNDAAIFKLLSSISPNFGKLSFRGLLNQKLFTRAVEACKYWVKWYQFLDTARTKIFGNNTEREQQPPQMFLSNKKLYTVMSVIADFHSVDSPTNFTMKMRAPMDFIVEANRLVYNAWLARMDSIFAAMEKLAEDIERAYESRALEFTRVEDLRKDIGNLIAFFSNPQQSQQCKSCKITPATLVIIVRRTIERSNLTVPSSEGHFRTIIGHSEFLDALAPTSEELSSLPPNRSFEAFGKTVAYLQTKLKWYNYMAELDNKLSGFQVQRERSSIQLLLGSSSSQLTSQKATEFVPSVSLTLSLSPPSNYAQNFKYPTGKASALQHLAGLLNRTLFSSTSCYTSDGVLTVRGVYIILSQALTTCNWRNINRVILTAHHTLFVDTDMNARRVTNGNTLDVVIIARNIYSVVAHSIEITGNDAVLPSPSAGRDGRPGLPGGESGAFVLISDSVQGQRMTVSLKGGRGSDGLEGSRGTQGSNGNSPSRYSWGSHTDPRCDPTRKFSVSVHSSFRVSRLRELGPSDVCNGEVYRIYGKDGNRGGSGGEGGKGGAGGNPSYHAVKVLGGSSSGANLISVMPTVGQGGSDGAGGPGGTGGLAGSHLDITFRRRISVDENSFSSSSTSVIWNCETVIGYSPGGSSDQRASDGQRGNRGGNTQGWRAAVVGSRFSAADARKYASDYVRRAENLKWDILGQSTHEKFVQRLRSASF